jgi:hypothetical protein
MSRPWRSKGSPIEVEAAYVFKFNVSNAARSSPRVKACCPGLLSMAHHKATAKRPPGTSMRCASRRAWPVSVKNCKRTSHTQTTGSLLPRDAPQPLSGECGPLRSMPRRASETFVASMDGCTQCRASARPERSQASPKSAVRVVPREGRTHHADASTNHGRTPSDEAFSRMWPLATQLSRLSEIVQF